MAKPKLVKKQEISRYAYKIESGIPLPLRKKPNPYLTLFERMKIGDSFLIGIDIEAVRHVKYQAARYGKEFDVTFAFRELQNGHRCWRVK